MAKPLRLKDIKAKEASPPPQTAEEPAQISFPTPQDVPEASQIAPIEAYSPPMFDYEAAKANPIAEMAQRELCRRRLLPFIQRFRPKYLAGWVHADICRRIERFVEQVEQGLSPRLLLMMPPRSGKSEISSRHTPAFILGRHPEWEIIAASHTSSLSLSFSRYLRDLMRDPAYQAVFPDAQLDKASQSVENWNLTKGGGYLAAGVGTGITGRGCLAPYTLVDTNRGKIRIIDLKVGDSVYGYDHKERKVIETCVKALQVTERSRQLLDFGNVRLTTDHRIYNAITGLYTRAGESPNLLGLRREEGSSRCNVQRVLFESADGSEHSAQMRLLWGELSAQRSGTPEIAGSTRVGSEGVLQPTLLRPVQDQQPGGVQQGEGRVPALQEPCHRDGSFQVLQQGLLQRVQGFETADGCVQWRVSDPEEAVAAAGREVHAVRYDPRSVRSAPHQQGRDGQQDFESCAALRGVPPQISSVHGTCAADIAGVFEPFDFVLDIQTGTGNFFTEGLLVHNCHVLLLDDLVKDIEAADSITIRDNTWEWYLSTAYTRIAPGGGVLGLMCMTGDTPVMMADGSWRRLDTLKASDEIATYACGMLGATRVAAMRSSGHDSVFKMTTKSGKIVRANQRHPFLTVASSGEVSWARLKNLTTDHKIVVVKGSGENGEGSPVLPRAATSLLSVVAFATATTTSKNGQTGAEPSATAMNRGATLDSSTATASQQRITTLCTRLKAAAAQFAGNLRKRVTRLLTGKKSSQSTTATTRGKYEVCSATTATQESDTLVMSRWHYPPQGISDFTLDEIVSIEPDGYEEVFDVQVNCTENFIANGLVSHNTWWHDDDWAGRIQQAMKDDGDHFEIIRYPAINEYGDEYILPDDTIIECPPDTPVPPGARLTRKHNTAIHPARYTTEMMLRIKNNLVRGGQKRVWDALYQQNPIPDEGSFFEKQMFRYYGAAPDRRELYIYQAWDFAISEGKESDYNVGVTIGVDFRDNVYVLDVRRFKTSDGMLIAASVLDYYAEWDAHSLGVEDGQIWKSLETLFQKFSSEKKIYPTYDVLKPLTDKMVRASPLRGRMQAGKVYFPSEAHWLDECRKEMLHFPAGKHDDQCFIAGTRIAMADGTTRGVEDVVPGDMVHTPLGSRRVVAAAMTNASATVYDTGLFVGTANHPVWTKNRGWVPLSALTRSDILQAIVSQDSEESSCRGFIRKLRATLTRLSSTGIRIAATLTHRVSTFSAITPVVAAEASCIATFGSPTTDLSLTDTRFITVTGTPSTTTLATLSVCHAHNMIESTQKVGESTVALRNSRPTLLRFVKRLLSGISLKRVGLGTENMVSRAGHSASAQLSPALSVGQASSLNSPMQSSAPRAVKTATGTGVTRITKLPSELSAKQPVYNITVEEAHCYYANGVLVHNCDALSWAVRLTLTRSAPRDPREKNKVKTKSWKDRLKGLGMEGGSHMAA